MTETRGSDSDGTIELVAQSEAFDPDDERWLAQVADFYADLRENGVPIRQKSVPVPGAKGDVAAVILALGSAGAFTAAVAAFRAFLSRERTRTLVVRWLEDGNQREVVVTADADSKTIERITRQAMRQSSRK